MGIFQGLLDRTITDFESIANAERLLATDSPSAFSLQPSALVPHHVHSAIMNATHDLVTSGENTPTKLLALQRLADFPARAEYRAHKDAMDTHRQEMDAHRKDLANQRLNLAKKSFEFRERLALLKSKDTSANIGQTQSGPSPDTVANTLKSSEKHGQTDINT
jgi:hypothetical protein